MTFKCMYYRNARANVTFDERNNDVQTLCDDIERHFVRCVYCDKYTRDEIRVEYFTDQIDVYVRNRRVATYMCE
jgi:hypothetical protein